jgi:hypothetical protein
MEAGTEHSGAEGIGVDRGGKIDASVVRADDAREHERNR